MSALDRSATRRFIETILSAFSGALLGIVFGFYGPVLFALAMGDDPIHTGHYGDWIDRLMIALPIILGAAFVIQSWRGRWRAGLRVSWGIALALGVWQSYLAYT